MAIKHRKQRLEGRRREDREKWRGEKEEEEEEKGGVRKVESVSLSMLGAAGGGERRRD